MRKTTNNNVCMVELGLPALRALIKENQRKRFPKMWLERNAKDDKPLMHAVRMVLDYNDLVFSGL